MIDLAFTLFLRSQDQAFAMGLAAVYSSIRGRTKACLQLHVIVDNSVGIDVQEKLSAMLKGSDRINFYPVSSLPEVESLGRSIDTKFSPAIIWRLWLAEYLAGLDRCLMLDCDLLFCADIQKIWDIELGENALSAPLRGRPHPAALHDWLKVLPAEYFRVCCCLFDLKRLRNSNQFVENKKKILLESQKMFNQGLHQAGFLEQSVFNYFFSKVCIPLPLPVIPVERMKNHPRRKDWEPVLLGGGDCILDTKGWTGGSPYASKFWSLLLDTPWRPQALRFFEDRLG